MTNIAAVVLNYRTPDDTILAARSLQAADAPIVPLIIVDNGSGDDSVTRIRDGARGVDVIALPENVGFSAGCNAGIRRALEHGATYVLLLNSDTILPPDALLAMQRVLMDDPSIGIAGPIVRVRSNPGVIESLGISYAASSGRMRLIANGSPVESVAPFARRIVDAVSGCAMLVRRDVFERVGLFAEEYFFGFEDLDICLRAREQGILSACAGSAFVLHEGNRTIGRQSDRRAYFAMRNHLLLASRFPSGQSRMSRGVRLANVTALNMARAVTSGEVPGRRGLRGCLSGAVDFVRGRFGAPVNR